MKGKELTIYLLSIILVAVIAGGAAYLWQQNEVDELKQQLSVAEGKLAAHDDEHNEEQSNDSQSTTVEEETETETAPAKTDEQLMTEAMAARHSKTVAETDLSINENNGTYASGVVKFSGEISGAWWLAAKTSGSWVIVADGNGVVMCSDIAGYNFPESMVPECWNDGNELP